MANVLGELFGAIAAAIRGKTGGTTKMSPKDFPTEIENIVVSVGGGSAEDSGWVTVLEETDITPTYDANLGCYRASLSNINWIDDYLSKGCSIFIVHYNGIKYPIGMQANAVKITSGALSGQYMARVHAGNLAIQTLFFGQSYTPVTSSYSANEPFCLIGSKPLDILFADGATRKIQIEYMLRTIDT